jgi:hypothetical protein
VQVGLLSKTNSKATIWSVLRQAVLAGVVSAAFWALCLRRDWPREYWLTWFIILTLGGMLLGGLAEWQVPYDELDGEEPGEH